VDTLPGPDDNPAFGNGARGRVSPAISVAAGRSAEYNDHLCL
jgi:hypothetical protein